MSKNALLAVLEAHGFNNSIIKAFKAIPRKIFIPIGERKYAYEDVPLPLVNGATISQPSTIAFMLKLLELEDEQNVLEIDSGSGYVLALISEISKKSRIYGLEIIKELVDLSQKILIRYQNISIIHKDGSKGLPEKALFDRILVSAASDKIPIHLYSQLKKDGIIFVPMQHSIFQIKKTGEYVEKKNFLDLYLCLLPKTLLLYRIYPLTKSRTWVFRVLPCLHPNTSCHVSSYFLVENPR